MHIYPFTDYTNIVQIKFCTSLWLPCDFYELPFSRNKVRGRGGPGHCRGPSGGPQLPVPVVHRQREAVHQVHVLYQPLRPDSELYRESTGLAVSKVAFTNQVFSEVQVLALSVNSNSSPVLALDLCRISVKEDGSYGKLDEELAILNAGYPI